MTNGQRVVTFGEFELDAGRGELRRSGQPVPIEPRVFDLIAHFADRPGEIVTRDDLIETVWRGRIVSDSAISTQINAARAALGDDGASQRMIRTIPRRGFRFEVDVGHSGSSPHPPLPDKPSLAVLPFQNMSSDPEQEYFADGISEDIITELCRIGWLFVIAHNTTLSYKGQTVDVRQVARELGVRYVLEGSVRKAGRRLRINALLVDGESGKQIWAEKYDRDLEDVFEVQDEITESIAGALEPRLATAESVRARQKAVPSLDAWDLVIQAMAKIGEFSKSASDEAIALLDRAIEVDPAYAKAYSQKAWTISWRTMQGWEDAEHAIPAAMEAAESALRFDPDDPWAYIALFFVAANRHEGPRMISTASKAIELNPNFALAHSFLGAALALTGNGAEAFRWIEKARRLSPRDTFRIEFDVHAGAAHFQTGDYRRAAEFFSKALEPKPDHLYPHLFLAASHAHLGALEDARNQIDKILRLAPEYSLALAEERCVYTEPDEKARFLDGLRKAGLPE